MLKEIQPWCWEIKLYAKPCWDKIEIYLWMLFLSSRLMQQPNSNVSPNSSMLAPISIRMIRIWQSASQQCLHTPAVNMIMCNRTNNRMIFDMSHEYSLIKLLLLNRPSKFMDDTSDYPQCVAALLLLWYWPMKLISYHCVVMIPISTRCLREVNVFSCVCHSVQVGGWGFLYKGPIG